MMASMNVDAKALERRVGLRPLLVCLAARFEAEQQHEETGMKCPVSCLV